MAKGSADIKIPKFADIVRQSGKLSGKAKKLAKKEYRAAKKLFKYNKKVLKQTSAEFMDIMDQQRQTAEDQRALADEQFGYFQDEYDRYKKVFQPVEDRIVKDAMTYDTPERREREAAEAKSLVYEEADRAREAAVRDLEGYGLNPSSTRYASLDFGARTASAVSAAGAANAARERVEEEGRDLRDRAAAIGAQYPQRAGILFGQGATASGLANQSQALGLEAGSAGAGMLLDLADSGARTKGTAPAYMGIQTQANANWADVLNQIYQNNINAAQVENSANKGGGIGKFAGFLGGGALKLLAPGLFQHGGPVPDEMSPTGGALPDDVPAKLTAGEFVIPEDVVRWKGEEYFAKQIENARKKSGEANTSPSKGSRSAIPEYDPTKSPKPQHEMNLRANTPEYDPTESPRSEFENLPPEERLRMHAEALIKKENLNPGRPYEKPPGRRQIRVPGIMGRFGEDAYDIIRKIEPQKPEENKMQRRTTNNSLFRDDEGIIRERNSGMAIPYNRMEDDPNMFSPSGRFETNDIGMVRGITHKGDRMALPIQ